VFVISVAAELTGLHPQTLRGYDRLGLVSPGRSGGGGRRYSWRDIERLREISRLSTLGIGLEGIRRILELESDVDTLLGRVAELEAQLHQARTDSLARRHLPEPVGNASSALVLWRSRER
jgi:MerR family transcriptional regulator/heat shock protein HspR